MAKESGLGWTSYSIDSSDTTPRDIVNDIVASDWDHPRETIDSTGLDKSSHERLIGLGDFTVNITAKFNDAANPSSFGVFNNIASTDVTRTVVPVISGQTLTNECFLTSAALARATDGDFQFSLVGVLNNGTDATWS